MFLDVCRKPASSATSGLCCSKRSSGRASKKARSRSEVRMQMQNKQGLSCTLRVTAAAGFSGRGHLQSFSRRGLRQPKAQRSRLGSADITAPPGSEVDERWQRLVLMRRQLQLAVSEQDFARAAELKEIISTVREALPPSQQFLLHKLQQLSFGSLEEKEQALKAIGNVGGFDILGEVVLSLGDRKLQRHAMHTCYAIWHRNSNPAVAELMQEGCQLMLSPRSLQQAEKLFSQMIHLDPSFAEGWNKRATCRFHLGSYQESIDDCIITTGLNAYHFGAFVGQGFCHLKLRQHRPAMASFNKALAIHPGLDEIREYCRVLQLNTEKDGGDSII